MKKKSSGLDSLFRENLSDYELSEKKGSWELMNHLLNERANKKKRIRLFLFVVSFFFIFVAGVFFILPPKNKDENTAKTTLQSNPITESPSITNTRLNKNADSSLSVNPSKKNKNAEGTENNNPGINDEAFSSLREEKNIMQHLTKEQEVNDAGATHNLSAVYPTISNNPEIINPKVNIPVQYSGAILFKEMEISNLSAADSSYLMRKDSLSADSIIPVTEIVSSIGDDTLKTKSNYMDSIRVAIRKDSTNNTASNEGKILSVFKFLNVHLGANIYSAAHEDFKNVSPLIGIEFTRRLGSKANIGFGSLYSLQGGYNLCDTATQIHYFLDKEISHQMIQIYQLHKLYFPLAFYYSLTPKQALYGGVQLTCLLSTKGEYSELTQSSMTNTQSQKTNVKGYMDGIKSSNGSLFLGYRYALANRFDLSFRITRDLTASYIKDSFYGVSTKPALSFQTFLIVKF